MPVLYDESQWPIVRIVVPSEPVTEDGLDAHLRRIQSYFGRGSAFVLLVDQTRSAGLPPRQRRRMADVMRQGERTHPGSCRGAAIVVKSALHRGIITALR